MTNEITLQNCGDCKDLDHRPRDNINGRWCSQFAIEVGSHPKSKEIISLIKNRVELKLTYKQLAEKIKKEYDLDFSTDILRNYYIKNHLPNGQVFKYVVEEEEKAMNLLEEFHEAKADLNIERSCRKMAFVAESNLGMPFPDSWRRSAILPTLRREVLQLGSAVGFYPQLQFGPTIQINNNQQNNFDISETRIMKLLDATLPPRTNRTSNDSTSKV